jgi:hypothetical protein
MTSHHTKLKLGQTFWMEWILANCLGHSVGLALPIMIADLVSARSYTNYLQAAFLTFGIWVGLAQWVVLRKFFSVSPWWVGVVALSPLVSTLLVLPFLSIVQSEFFWIFVTYAFLLGLGQWNILRQTFKLSWHWITASFAIVILSGIGGICFTLFIKGGIDQVSVFVPMGSLFCGFVYGLLTGLSLRYLAQKKQTPSVKQDLGFDPSVYQAWRVQLILSIIPLSVMVGWILAFPAPSTLLCSNCSPFYTLLCWVASMYGAILIHEIGHLLLALTNGFDVKAFSIGRWVFVRRGERMQLCRTHHQWAAGFVMPLPRTLDSLNKRVFMMILGGPLASFLLTCLGLLPLIFQNSGEQNGLAWFIAFCSITNLCLTLNNVLPIKIGSLITDGRRMLDLAQNNLQGKRFIAIYAFLASSRQGIRPRDVDPAIVERALLIPEKSSDHISGLLTAYGVALDKGEFEQAGDYLDQAIALNTYYPALFRGSLFLEAAYFEAHIRGQAELARQWFGKIQDTALLDPAALLRAEAAVLLAEGDLEGARVKAEQGIIWTQRDRFMVGNAIAENEMLQSLLEEIG